MNHKEMTAHIRNRLAKAGVKAKCKMQDLCGHKVIAIDTPTFESRFTPAEQTLIVGIVMANRLTAIRGLPVTDNGTHTHGGKFEFSA